jgi:Raf kinase inhibitor-like YbhB/YbcL family protein
MSADLTIGSLGFSIAAGFLFLLAMAGGGGKFNLTSSAFGDGKAIPAQYANTGVAGGKNVSPPLSWTNPPAGTQSFALACVDRHPVANNWIHWLVINIPKATLALAEGAAHTGNLPSGAKELQNSFGKVGWGGPQPPSGTGPHHYEFLLYALNVDSLNLGDKTALPAFNKAIEGKVVATAKLVGTFER